MAVFPVLPEVPVWAISLLRPGTVAHCLRQERDMIHIDLNKHLLEVEVSEEELARRKAEIVKPDHPAYGIMKQYRKVVEGAEKGAVWLYTD